MKDKFVRLCNLEHFASLGDDELRKVAGCTLEELDVLYPLVERARRKMRDMDEPPVFNTPAWHENVGDCARLWFPEES